MENNPINKLKFVAQYYGQEVLISETGKRYRVNSNSLSDLFVNKGHLELTPIAMISKELLSEIAEILGFSKDFTPAQYEEFREELISIFDKNERMDSVGFNMLLDAYQHLQSKGVALRCHGLTIGEQIARNWITLKTQ